MLHGTIVVRDTQSGIATFQDLAGRQVAVMAGDNAEEFMQREGITNEDEALRVLKSIDEARRKWGLRLYGIDTNDPSLYDLVIHIRKITPAM